MNSVVVTGITVLGMEVVGMIVRTTFRRFRHLVLVRSMFVRSMRTVSGGTPQGPESEYKHQYCHTEPNTGLLHDCAQACGGSTGSQHRRYGTESKGQHRQRCLRAAALGQGKSQGTVDQATG